jgi:hypothetical protein
MTPPIEQIDEPVNKPEFGKEDIRVGIEETVQIVTKEFDTVTVIHCGARVGNMTAGLFYVGECD